MSFTHLQVRSGYSLFQSTMTIEKLVQHAETMNYQAIALTDEHVLYGAVAFYEACMKRNIKPIMGLVVPVFVHEVPIPIILYAKTNEGYKQLIAISTMLETEEEKSILDLALDELICIVPTGNDVIKRMIVEGNIEEIITLFTNRIKENDLYIGLLSEDKRPQLVENLRKLEETTTIRTVALHDVRYEKQQDFISYDCLQAMHEGRKWQSENIEETGHRYMKSAVEMQEAFADWPEIVARTEEIVAKCDVVFDFDKQLLPKFPVPEGETAEAYLRSLCEKTLLVKYPQNVEEARARLTEELRVIHHLGFDDYFLIVHDFVQFAKDNNIVVGPGRGSAAGSIVSYLLHITDVDPLKYDLLFERFLNPERVTMPDIDIDFSDIRRDEVIQYVKNKYGEDYVAQIITFGTFAARSLLRELMKTMDIHEEDQQYVLRHIPRQRSESILTSVNASEEFKQYIKKSEKLRQLFSVAVKLEGLPRHVSTHAAGIVIGKNRLIEDVPLTRGIHETYLTQYAMNELEKVGLLKMDILGLKNLTLLERIVTSVERTEKIKLNLNELPEDDAKTFELLRQGKTNGVFQLESSGMKSVLQRLKPSNLEDVIAVNALYRPGPMDYIPTYIERKHGTAPFQYIHPDLANILQKTYGVLIYQEQIMQIAHQFAGLSLGEADILRRAVSKKDKQEMEWMEQRFMEGCERNGYDSSVAREVFSWIIKFANYGFNKSHSVAYSKIAYQLSYLKANYPTYFYAHILSTVANEPEKLLAYVREAKEAGIDVLPPSINKSHAYFTVENGHIRIGLLAMKGIGYETAKDIIDVRKDGLFKDLFDFTLRMRTLKRNVLETLIFAGAFDEIYENRASLLASIDQAYERADLFGQSLFSSGMDMAATYVDIDDFDIMQKLQEEKDILNMYISSHPFESIRMNLALKNIQSIPQMKQLQDRTQVETVGIVQTIRKTHTKRSETMAFATISDEFSNIDIVIFPSAYRQVSNWLKEDSVVIIQGMIDSYRGNKQMIANHIHQLVIDEWQATEMATIYIKLTDTHRREDAMQFLQALSKKQKGTARIIIYDERDKKTYMLADSYCLQNNQKIIERLKAYFGEGSVVVK